MSDRSHTSDPPPRAPLWRRGLGAVWTGVVGAVVIAVAALYTWDDKVNTPWAAATAFFRTFGRQGAEAAYARAAPELRAAIDPESFARLAGAARLDQVRRGGWNDRDFGAAAADMGGHLYLRDGAKLPNVVRLKRKGWMWKVTGFQVAGAAPIGPPAPRIDYRPLQRAALTSRPAEPVAAAPLSSPSGGGVRVSREVGGMEVDAATGVPIAPPRLPHP